MRIKSITLANADIACQCAWCKKFRVNDEWIEPTQKLLSKLITHGICPKCLKEVKKGMLR